MNDLNLPRVGFVGLGVMGAAMAANLQKAGYALLLNDLREQAAAELLANGAAWRATPAEVAREADVVFSCLPDLKAVESVALGETGVLSGIRPGQAYFELSTGSLELSKRLHAAFAARGAHMLEAPISGGGPGARHGRLAIWVGGEREIFDRYAAVLRAMADRPLFVGPIGSATVTKLVHNCTSQAVQAAISEVFVMGVKAGAEPLALWEAVRQGALGRRRTFDGLADQFLTATYDDPHAALRIIHKDMMLATGLGREVGAPMRLSELALADITEAMERGWAERDCRSVMLLPQERAGVRIAQPAEAVREIFRRDPPAPTDTKNAVAPLSDTTP